MGLSNRVWVCQSVPETSSFNMMFQTRYYWNHSLVVSVLSSKIFWRFFCSGSVLFVNSMIVMSSGNIYTDWDWYVVYVERYINNWRRIDCMHECAASGLFIYKFFWEDRQDDDDDTTHVWRFQCGRTCMCVWECMCLLCTHVSSIGKSWGVWKQIYWSIIHCQTYKRNCNTEKKWFI